MLLIALGSWQLGKLADRLPGRVTAFILTQVLVAIILVLEIPFARSINNLVGIEPGEVVGLFPVFYCSLLVLAPLGILHGFQFALASRILSTGSDAPAVEVGKVYICEAILNYQYWSRFVAMKRGTEIVRYKSDRWCPLCLEELNN